MVSFSLLVYARVWRLSMSDCLILLTRVTRRMSSLLAPSFSLRGSRAEVYFCNSCFLCQLIELDYFLASSLSRMCFHLALLGAKLRVAFEALLASLGVISSQTSQASLVVRKGKVQFLLLSLFYAGTNYLI